jgi:hypothetical protein
MRIIHHSEHAALAAIAEQKAKVQAVTDPAARAPLVAELKARQDAHRAIRDEHRPRVLAELTAEREALLALPAPVSGATRKRLGELQQQIPWLEDEADLRAAAVA